MLLDHADAAAAQGHRLRLDLRRNVAELLPASAGRKVELALVLNQSAVVIVDGDGDVALRGLSGCRQRLGEKRPRGGERRAGQEQNTHDKTLPVLRRPQCYTVTLLSTAVRAANRY